MDNAVDNSCSHTNTVLDSYLSVTDLVYAKIQSIALKILHKILYEGTYFELRPKFVRVWLWMFSNLTSVLILQFSI